jgi:hypothetical protein
MHVQDITFCVALYIMQGYPRVMEFRDANRNVWLSVKVNIDGNSYNEKTNTFQEGCQLINFFALLSNSVYFAEFEWL